MPHIVVKMYKGRTEETKKDIADILADALSEKGGIDRSAISVAIEDIPEENWKEQVYDKELKEDNKNLYIKPGYKM